MLETKVGAPVGHSEAGNDHALWWRGEVDGGRWISIVLTYHQLSERAETVKPNSV